MHIIRTISPKVLKLLLAAAAVGFVSVVAYSYSTGITGLTRKNGGAGCYCHNGTPSPNVIVTISGPDSVAVGDTVYYTVNITGGPLVRGGTNIAVENGVIDTVLSSGLRKSFGELIHRAPKEPVAGSVSFQFRYRAPLVNTGKDTLYANGNSVNFNGNNTGDQWNFADDKIITITDPIGIINISQIAEGFSLSQNYPNPFNPATNIKFSVGKSSDVIVKVYDALGNEAALVVSGKLARGQYSVDFNASQLSSGIYFYAMFSDGVRIATKKMILVK